MTHYLGLCIYYLATNSFLAQPGGVLVADTEFLHPHILAITLITSLEESDLPFADQFSPQSRQMVLCSQAFHIWWWW